jgi:DNA-binding transcriptional ArsR family regulator
MDHLSQTFSALADPTRRAILAQLSKGEASVSDLARPFLGDMSLPGVTKHLKVLERAGLVTKSRDAQWRPCRLNAPALKEAADWMEQYRVFWEESLDRLGEYLATVQEQERAAKQPGPKQHVAKQRGARLLRAKPSVVKRATAKPAAPKHATSKQPSSKKTASTRRATSRGTPNVRKK